MVILDESGQQQNVGMLQRDGLLGISGPATHVGVVLLFFTFFFTNFHLPDQGNAWRNRKNLCG